MAALAPVPPTAVLIGPPVSGGVGQGVAKLTGSVANCLPTALSLLRSLSLLLSHLPVLSAHLN